MKEIIGVYAGIFNATLDEYLMHRLDCPSPVKDAVAYAMTGGGKRLRPILCYLGAEFAGKSCEEVSDFALAVELIHGYSLIHDVCLAWITTLCAAENLRLTSNSVRLSLCLQATRCSILLSKFFLKP